MKSHNHDPLNAKYRFRARAAGIVTALGLGVVVEAAAAPAAAPASNAAALKAEASPRAYADKVSSRLNDAMSKMLHTKGVKIHKGPEYKALGLKEAVEIDVKSKTHKGYDYLYGAVALNGQAAALQAVYGAPHPKSYNGPIGDLGHETYRGLDHMTSTHDSFGYDGKELWGAFKDTPAGPGKSFIISGTSQQQLHYPADKKVIEHEVDLLFDNTQDIIDRAN